MTEAQIRAIVRAILKQRRAPDKLEDLVTLLVLMQLGRR